MSAVVVCNGLSVHLSYVGCRWRHAWSHSSEWSPASPARGPVYKALKAAGKAGVEYSTSRKWA